MQIAYPYHLDSQGRTATAADQDAHLRDLIEQVLFTAPGERVNRPEFGSGLRQLVFAPNSDELATATEYLIHGALQRWLGELISIEAVRVESEETTLRITVEYTVRRTQERRTARFARRD